MSIPKAGALAKASDWSTVFPLDTDGWTTYTPTLTQNAAVAKTVNTARYTRIGRWVSAQIALTVTGTGTASNGVLVGLPVQSATATVFGSAYLLDVSAGLFYAGIAYPSTGLVAGILLGSTAGTGNIAGIAGFTAALASGDVIQMNLQYEALT